MKYIRTKDGIFEQMFPNKEYQISFDHKTFEPAYYTIHYEWVDKRDVIKQADTIPELCDCYIIKDKDEKYPFTTKKVKNLDYANNKDRHNFEIYGAIWAEGEHGEPILKSVTKPMNEEGELELI